MRTTASLWQALAADLAPAQVDELSTAMDNWPHQRGVNELVAALRGLQAQQSARASANGDRLASSANAYAGQDNENAVDLDHRGHIQLVDSTTPTPVPTRPPIAPMDTPDPPPAPTPGQGRITQTTATSPGCTTEQWIQRSASVIGAGAATVASVLAIPGTGGLAVAGAIAGAIGVLSSGDVLSQCVQ
jgi:hypothetical protein